MSSVNHCYTPNNKFHCCNEKKYAINETLNKNIAVVLYEVQITSITKYTKNETLSKNFQNHQSLSQVDCDAQYSAHITEKLHVQQRHCPSINTGLLDEFLLVQHEVFSSDQAS